MNKFQNAAKKTLAFLRKNIYYVLIVCCIAAIGTMVLVTTLNKQNDNSGDNPVIISDDNDQPAISDGDDNDQPADVDPDDEKPDIPVDVDPVPEVIVFVSPVDNATVTQGYSMDALVWSSTLKQYQTHSGVDFAAEEGTAVKAAYDGTVESVTNDTLNGIVVTINHGNGLVTRYASLGETSLAAGNAVAKGATVGTVSTTMLTECSDGSHLHFEVMLNGEYIDPYTYLVTEGK